MHRGPDGRPVVPVRMLYSSMMSAGVFIRLDGKRQVSTKSESNLPGLMTIVGTAPLTLFLPGTDKEPPWDVDLQQGVNPNGGEAVCVIRPIFYEWEIRPTFQIDLRVFGEKAARELVDIAGRRMGVGSFRPSRRGTYGQYVVAVWDVQNRN